MEKIDKMIYELIVKLFENGIPEFDEYKFKLHEIFKVLLFLMKLNLRKPPNGKLTDELINEIGKIYVEIARRNNLRYDLVCGLPQAGDPLAAAFIANGGANANQRIYLKKEQLGSGKRRILPEITGEYRAGQIVLGIDDVNSLGGSKEEGIKAFLCNNLSILHFICLMDWGVGGKKIIEEKYGVKIITAFSVETLLQVGFENGFVGLQQMQDVIDRRDKIKESIDKIILAY